MSKIPLTGLMPEQISDLLGLKPYQGRQLFQWLHGKRVFSFDRMTNLSKDLRRRLEQECLAAQLDPIGEQRSSRSSGTRKVLYRLQDGETVESVLIKDGKRTTICVSTQVGCPIRCAFCATGRSGFVRNLSAGEIVEQALHLIAGESLSGRVPNIVYMGMGEPFRNYEATVQSIHLFMHRDGVGVGARKITISTVGEAEGIRRFAREGMQVRLSISMHAGNDQLRTELIPQTIRTPLKALMDAIHEYLVVSGRRVSFEWTLIAGVNDSPKDVDELSHLARDLKASVNLIPYNPVEGLEYDAPTSEACQRFRDQLTRSGVNCTLRAERGSDINAACGQLRRHSKNQQPRDHS